MNDVKKQNDLSGFYRHLLNNTLAKEEVPEPQIATERVAKYENIDNNQHQKDQLADSDNKAHRKMDDRKHERRRRSFDDNKSDDEKRSDESKDTERISDNDHNQTRTNSLKRNIDDTENETNHRKIRKDNLSGETTKDVTSEEHDIITSKATVENKTSVFDRRNASDTVSAARERYLARKKEKATVKAIFDDHAN